MVGRETLGESKKKLTRSFFFDLAKAARQVFVTGSRSVEQAFGRAYNCFGSLSSLTPELPQRFFYVLIYPLPCSALALQGRGNIGAASSR